MVQLNMLGMSLKQLKPICDDSKRLVDWIEQGAYNALQKRYLKTMTFAISSSEDAQVLLESYEFTFKYCKDGGTTMELSSVSTKPHESKMDKNMSPEEVKKLACKMVRVLCELMKVTITKYCILFKYGRIV
jgi:hypothetical protein